MLLRAAKRFCSMMFMSSAGGSMERMAAAFSVSMKLLRARTVSLFGSSCAAYHTAAMATRGLPFSEI
jgi:hypothetical protein